MSEQPGPPPRPRTVLQDTPNAERYVLEADAMRRRQLRSALLHGSRRTWREHARVWPAVVAGIVVAAVIVASLAVVQALHKTEENQKKEQQQQQTPGPSSPGTSPSGVPTGTGSPSGKPTGKVR